MKVRLSSFLSSVIDWIKVQRTEDFFFFLGVAMRLVRKGVEAVAEFMFYFRYTEFEVLMLKFS
jgi:hypothetical protein